MIKYLEKLIVKKFIPLKADEQGKECYGFY